MKQMKFQVDFDAEDAARLTPCKDDKSKYTEIALFKTSSDYPLSDYIIHYAKLANCDFFDKSISPFSRNLSLKTPSL